MILPTPTRVQQSNRDRSSSIKARWYTPTPSNVKSPDSPMTEEVLEMTALLGEGVDAIFQKFVGSTDWHLPGLREVSSEFHFCHTQ